MKGHQPRIAVGVEFSEKNPVCNDWWKGYRYDTGEAVLDPKADPETIAGEVDREILELGL